MERAVHCSQEECCLDAQPGQRADLAIPRIKILALGSPHGDDQIAWHVAERLQRDPRLAGLVHKISTPWDLIDHAQAGTRLILLDACRAGLSPGTIVRSNECQLKELEDRRCSSHGGTVSSCLQMARALGRDYKEALIVAVEIEAPSVGPDLSATFDRAAAALESEVRATLSAWDFIV